MYVEVGGGSLEMVEELLVWVLVVVVIELFDVDVMEDE